MKTLIYIIIDVSGSMNEMGKLHLQRNLCRYITQLPTIDKKKYMDIGFHLYQWAQNISEIYIQDDGDVPLLMPKGSSDLRILSNFLSQGFDSTPNRKILLLSDGNFNSLDVREFKEQLNLLSKLILRTVAIGADADLLKLKKISTNNTVYLSEDIASAIDSTIFASDEPLTAPVSTSQILQSKLSESEEPEEEWDA
jgi:hypothetical protein